MLPKAIGRNKGLPLNEENPKLSWLFKAKDTHKIHIANIKNNKDWTIEKTAKALGRSIGSVCEDIKISKWHRTHPTKLERCHSAREALEFIKEKKDEMELEES